MGEPQVTAVFSILIRPTCRYAAPQENGKFIFQGRKYNHTFIKP